MYKFNLENSDWIKRLHQKYYANVLGLSQEYICKIFNSKLNCKLVYVKSIISIAYGISIEDYRMQSLIEKHFIKIK